MWRTINALFHPKETGVGVKDLSGPVGILAMLGAWVKTDYRLALNFLVLLNVNLAILNMLPIPVLDGGHTVMGFIEGDFSSENTRKNSRVDINLFCSRPDFVDALCDISRCV